VCVCMCVCVCVYVYAYMYVCVINWSSISNRIQDKVRTYEQRRMFF